MAATEREDYRESTERLDRWVPVGHRAATRLVRLDLQDNPELTGAQVARDRLARAVRQALLDHLDRVGQ